MTFSVGSGTSGYGGFLRLQAGRNNPSSGGEVLVLSGGALAALYRKLAACLSTSTARQHANSTSRSTGATACAQYNFTTSAARCGPGANMDGATVPLLRTTGTKNEPTALSSRSCIR